MSSSRFRLAGITIDCLDPAVVAGFWAALLERELSAPFPGWLRLERRDRAEPILHFQPVPEPKVGKTRIHLDLLVDDLDRAAAAIVELGGRSLDERLDFGEGSLLVMADPEGNEFCIVHYPRQPR